MKLYIMRHGIAMDPGAPGCPPDSQRPLTPEGEEKTSEVARGLLALGIAPDVFLSSPLLRAVQTAKLVAAVMKFPEKNIRLTEALLPEAKPDSIFLELARLTDVSAICFGHGPHVDRAIAHALGLRAPLTEMKKSGVACLKLESVRPPRGILMWLCPPKILRAVRD